jgi:hypothetical protein
MSTPNDRLSHEKQNGSPSNGNQSPNQMSSEILEHGDIFFFYRPKVGAREVTGIDDIRRFFMVTATDSRQLVTELEGGMHVRTKEKIQDPVQNGGAGDHTIASNNI